MSEPARGASLASGKLSCQNLWKSYGRAETDVKALLRRGLSHNELTAKLSEDKKSAALADVSFSIAEGEIFVIMGLSGSGKSTLIRCLARLIEPTAGQVLFDGQDLLAFSRKQLLEVRRHKMGMVFQHFGLMPHLSVLDNVSFALRMRGADKKSRFETARQMIAAVGLEGFEERFPHQLSGGQQQRVGIARSLAVDPEIWLLDEPFSALDPLIRREMQDEFLALQRKLQKTIIFVTHDFNEALRIADRVAILRQGQLIQLAAPREIVMRPKDSYVAGFTRDAPLSRVLTVEAVMDTDSPGPDAVPVPEDTSVEAAIKLFRGAVADLAVVSPEGRVLGSLKPAGLVRAMADIEAKRELAQG